MTKRLAVLLSCCAVLLWAAAVIGYQDWQRISAPGSNPASGYLRMWADNGSATFKCITSAGATCYFASPVTTPIPNSSLQNSSITIGGSGTLSGGGTVSLGGTLTLDVIELSGNILTNPDWCKTNGTRIDCNVTPITNNNQLTNGEGFISTLVPSTGVFISGNIIAIGQDVETSSSVQFVQVYATGQILIGGSAEIDGTGAGTFTIGTVNASVEVTSPILNTTGGGSSFISSGIGQTRMSTTNSAMNAAWIPLDWNGTTYYVPGWTTYAP